MGKLLKAEELSVKKGIPRSTVYWLAKTGQLPACHYGRKAVRFDEDLVDEWLRKRTNGAEPYERPAYCDKCGQQIPKQSSP